MDLIPFGFWAIFITVFGACVGSFLNVVIFRFQTGESIAFGRSHCRECKHTLAWYDLIPIFSYLFLRGRCRYCHERISARYLIVELLTGVLFLLLLIRYGITWALVKYLLLAVILLAVTFIDLGTLLIPDRLIIIGLIGGIVFFFLDSDVNIISGLIGAGVGFGFLLLVAIVSRGGMGGGDIKLAGLTGLFLGWPLGPLGLFFGVCSGGIISIILLLFKIKGRKEMIPFGPFIVLGTLLALFCGNQLISWYRGLF